jgi:hypothetical protein
VLLEEGVVHQLLDIGAFVGVLLQALIQEIPHLWRDSQVGGDFDLILNYLDEFLLAGDLEGILAYHHLVHHDADRPDVYLLVVFPSLQDLGADVERRPTKRGPQFVVLVDRPSEIAQFDDILHGEKGTSWRTIFSGLISL